MKYFFIFANCGIYDKENHRMSVGGVETYVHDLAHVAGENGYRPIIIEMNNKGYSDKYEFDNIEIWQVSKNRKKYFQQCFDSVFNKYNNNSNTFLIATDQFDIKSNSKNVIAIQHGIAFDGPIVGWKKPIIKLLRNIKNIWRLTLVKNTVCVDYNYYNWFKAVYTLPADHNITVIPNYASVSISVDSLKIKLKNSSRNKIVFARRFYGYRGTIIFVNAVKKLLVDFPNLEITFAGEGPLKNYIREQFCDDTRVTITSYSSIESVEFHSKYDIAVVPTLSSEGTSLSLLEAMAAGCYPIASCVGGLSNILLDGYNGNLIMPKEDDLYMALKHAIEMPFEDYSQIVKNAYSTATSAFSKEKWAKKWGKVINDWSA